MARTETEIEDSMITAQAAESALAGLTSSSLVALYRLWRSLVVAAIVVHEMLWDKKKAEFDALAANAQVFGAKWYAESALKFQYGHALSEKNGKLYYLVDEPAARIVTKVAVVEGMGNITIKVAKGAVGSLTPLTSPEKVSFTSYINAIKQPGTRTFIVSVNPDLVKTAVTVYYDGKLNLANFKTAVETAINNYLNNIFFGGQFSINKMRDAIEAVPGVVEPSIDLVQIKPNGGSYTTVMLTRTFAAGYGKIDPAFPLATQITYVPQ